jgi:hypothetical protein
LPQTGLAEILRPLADKWVNGGLRTPGSRPHRDLIGVPRGHSRAYQLLAILRNLFANRSHNRSVLFLRDFRLPLIDLVQNNLIESEIAGCGRIVSVPIRSEIEMFFA